MIKQLRFTSIKQKMIFGFSLIILLVICLGIYNFTSTKATNDDVNQIAYEDLPLVIANEGLVTTLSDRIALAYGYILFGDESYKDRFQQSTEEGIQYEAAVRQIHSSEEFDRLMEQVAEWREFIPNEVFSEYDRGNIEQAEENLATSVALVQELMAGYKEMAAKSEASIIEKEEELVSRGETSMMIGTIITVLVVVISIGVALITSNMVSRPIRTVMERMNLIANGDLSHEPLKTKAVDETGQLVTATNELNHNMRELLGQINDVSETVSSQSEELTQAANEVMAGTEQVAITMEELASGSESQADHSGELSTMMGTFVTQVEEANANGESIQASTHQVIDMTAEGEQLMQSSTEQMNMIDQIVHDAVAKVEGLDDHSQEISELVSVIQDIAEQTNLLALNAAIEAARAGEHGQGFAVVADEVRILAEQSSHSVTNITDIVERIQNESSMVASSLQAGYKEVEQGTEQIMVTGHTFKEISTAVQGMVDHINRVSENLSDIVANSQEMNSSIQEIAAVSEESAAGVEETSATTQQASSSMEEVSASSNDLAKMAEELNRLIQQFNL